MVVPVSLSFVRAPDYQGYPGLKGYKTVAVVAGMIDFRPRTNRLDLCTDAGLDPGSIFPLSHDLEIALSVLDIK